MYKSLGSRGFPDRIMQKIVPHPALSPWRLCHNFKSLEAQAEGHSLGIIAPIMAMRKFHHGWEEGVSRGKERDGRVSPSYEDHAVRVGQFEHKILYLFEFVVLKVGSPFQSNKVLSL
jgi:hypothetical protein